MTDLEREFLLEIELHDPARLDAAFAAGLDVTQPLAGKPATRWLTEMYSRSDHFPALMRALLSRGAELDEPRLAPVLCDDADALNAALRADPLLLERRTTLASAFTPLRDATLLHVAAEFGNLAALDVLLAAGADPNAAAGVDGHGLGSQTPIFHTVNTHANRGVVAMRRLLAAGARVDVRVPGLVWGEGFEWETTLFDLTPIAYAQCGGLPQFQRDEGAIAANVCELLSAARRPAPPLRNVPNRYLARG
jgi:Ankyrin repeat